MTIPAADHVGRRGGQSEVIRFLSSPAAHGGADVEVVETHASMVFLAGTRAFKLKRAVQYDYLDFSTLERRKACCAAELRINRRAAPALYRRVVPVTREFEGHLAIGGAGIPIEWLVDMNRFDQAQLFDRLAASGGLELAVMRPLGAAVAMFHGSAERRPDHGGAAGMTWVLDGNAAALRADASGAVDPALCQAFVASARMALQRGRLLLDERRAEGYVRQCHGDLHLGNVVMIDAAPTLFDAIEFNDELSCVDVLYDLAFLLMDLWHRRLPSHANAAFNGYLSATVDFDGLGLLPLFLSTRAAIRAKTQLAAAVLATSPARARELRQNAGAYLSEAAQLLQPARPSLIAVGGLSGTGKSTLARALAPALGPAPGAVVLRSDEVRKRLCGVPELTRLGPQGYTAEVSRMVYETMTSHAAAVVRAGHSAVVDAVFTDPADRAALEAATRAAGVPFVGLWLEAPEELLVDRVARRGGDASDADAAVIRMQRTRDTGTIGWHRLDASAAAGAVYNLALRHLHEAVAAGVILAA
jgi:aminoglycoside phosphotransferase family enzyme/predicted kinase